MYIPSAPIRKPAENTPRPHRRGASTTHAIPFDGEDDRHAEVVPRESASQGYEAEEFPHVRLSGAGRSRFHRFNVLREYRGRIALFSTPSAVKKPRGSGIAVGGYR